ncbi:MAG: hypothetical protein A2751_00855 [Candidatus Doudnabacteria bacterium RIFCSPHIGHO2_01_FULL_46_14]|uniref:Uncharacterized protein n=1 Tax=Candidatus Doudnabacteria bacterium RIFCSPHIGHO2_01_FULL_46_14 TaxID=1817824 RepID=A0A1F5NN88_9BACT|nr:MAG: hypothetical protein A2751_00855 [Candidatus Doudnabacteria bacterium RIFCSPHIGHO2_01_FULL_46_14]
MTPEKWEQIKDIVKKQFALEDQGTEDLIHETGDGPVKLGVAEFVVFEGPLGRMKLQFGQKPKVEGKKYHYSHQQGQGARVEYKFSDSELVNTFKVYKWNDMEDEWKEIDAEKFSL